MADLVLLGNVILVSLMMGCLYCLMALGITFIYSIMKIINWSMAGYYMFGGYLQFYIITRIVGPKLWFLAIPITMLTVFVIGIVYNRTVLSGLYERGVTRKFEYATVLTIFTLYFYENSAIYFIGERIYTPPEYFGRIMIGSLYHFEGCIKEIVILMLNSSEKIIISEPIKNLAGHGGLLGWIAKRWTDAGKGPEAFRFTEKTFLQMLERLGDELKFAYRVADRGHVRRPVTPDILRHTFAVTSIQKGISTRALQSVMGHNHLATTEIYLKLSPEDVLREYDEKW